MDDSRVEEEGGYVASTRNRPASRGESLMKQLQPAARDIFVFEGFTSFDGSPNGHDCQLLPIPGTSAPFGREVIRGIGAGFSAGTGDGSSWLIALL